MKVLLYSGGTDSWLIDKLWKPDIKLYINIHGKYSHEEISRLPKDVKIINFPFLGTIEDEKTLFVPLRNLYFLMIASNFGDEICLGAVLGDGGNKDKRLEFLEMTENIINYCLVGNSHETDKTTIVNKDFIKKHKYQLVEEYLKQGGTIKEFVETTFSCHLPINDQPCYDCKPCYRKFLIGYYFDYPYSDEIKKQMIEHIKREVLPINQTNGTYYSKRDGEGVYAEKAVDKLFKEFNLRKEDYMYD